MEQYYDEFETGIVINTSGDKAVVELTLQPDCENCGARMVCTPDTNGKKTLQVVNKLGAGVGSKVTIGESANFLLKMSTLQYGLPFLGFMAGILILYGLDFRLGNVAQELLFFIGGLIGLGISAIVSRQITKNLVSGEASFFRITKII